MATENTEKLLSALAETEVVSIEMFGNGGAVVGGPERRRGPSTDNTSKT